MMISGCKTAQFSGIETVGEHGQLTCSVTPPTAYPDKELKISVSVPKDYQGRITRLIHHQDDSSAITEKTELIAEPHKPLLLSQGEGSTSTITAGQKGDYALTFKTLDYVSIVGSCKFKVIEPCKKGRTRKGGYVAFIVDNSESHNVSDCPSKTRLGAHPNNANDSVYECRASTAREQAVQYATKILGSFGENDPKSQSHVSFAFFPEMKKNPRWYHPINEKNVLISDLRSLRQPLGVTPYNEGMASGVRIFSSLSSKNSKESGEKKQRLLLFITDGFPTDRSPSKTLELARTLRNTHGVKIISVMITGESFTNQLRKKHERFMKKFPMSPEPWMDASYNRQFEPYFRDLLGDGTEAYPGLLSNMSDEVIYIEDSKALPRAIDKITAKEVLECSDS